MNKYLLITISIVAFSSISFAGGNSEILDENIFELSLSKFNLAKEILEKRIEGCEKSRTVLNASLFKNIKIPEKQLEIALFFLSNRALDAGEQPLRGEFVIAANVYRSTASHLKRKATHALPYSEDLMFSHAWQKVEIEVKYLKIDKKDRAVLDGIKELQKPFYFFKILDKIKSDKK